MAKKLCAWNKKDIKEKGDKLISIIDTPKYICKKCARVAKKKDNLCIPIKIKKMINNS